MPAKKTAKKRVPDPNRLDLEKLRRVDDIHKKFKEFKKYDGVSSVAVENKWREILSEEKLQTQKLDIDTVRAGYIKQNDRCDAIISRLMHWIQDCEVQYHFALRSHKHNLELLMDLANHRLDDIENKYNDSLDIISKEYDKNRENTQIVYHKHVSDVRHIISAIDHDFYNRRRYNDAKFHTEEDALKVRNQEMMTTLKMHLMNQTNQVIMASKTKYEEYKKKTESKMHQFNIMLAKHQKRQKEMRLNEEQIIKNAAEIAHWRRKFRSNDRESRESNDRLRQEKENLSLHFRELKDTMAKFRKTESIKLAEISVAFEDINNDITKKLRLAEMILKFSEMNRDLETEREHVKPFPLSITETDPEVQRQMKQFKLQLKGDSKFVNESDQFDKFYRRYNKVLLDKLSLQREKAYHEGHNKYLRNILKKYINGTAISKDLIDKPNTLFIVNQITNAPFKNYDQDDIPIIDADLTLAANRLQGYK